MKVNLQDEALNIYGKLNLPEKNISVSKKEAVFIYHFIKRYNLKRTIEIGFNQGCSAAHIISASKKKHIVIDPENNIIGLENIHNLGLSGYLDHRQSISQFELPKLQSSGFKSDFIYFDGNYRFDYLITDLFYSAHILKRHGYLMVRDIGLPSIEKFLKFIETNKPNFKLVDVSPESAIYQKLYFDGKVGNSIVNF